MEAGDRFGHVHLQSIVVMGDGLGALHVRGAERLAGFNELFKAISTNCILRNGDGGAQWCLSGFGACRGVAAVWSAAWLAARWVLVGTWWYIRWYTKQIWSMGLR